MKYSILLVEDDEDMRDLLATYLRNQGFYIVSAADAQRALYLMAEQVKFDLLFTDIVMEGEMDGFQLAERAVRLQPALKVIYITGFARVASQWPERLHGALIEKPVRPNDLEHEIWRALEGEVPRVSAQLC